MSASYLIVTTHKEPCEAFIAQAYERDDLYAKVVEQVGLTKRAQIFELSRATAATHLFANMERLVKLNGVADVYLSGEREQVLERYITLTEEMTSEAALPELRRAAERIAAEIEKCETETISAT